MPNGQTAGEYASTLSPEIVSAVNVCRDLALGKDAQYQHIAPETRALYKRDNPVLAWLLTLSIFKWSYSEAVIVHTQRHATALTSTVNRYFLDFVLFRNADTLRQRQEDAAALRAESVAGSAGPKSLTL